MGCQMGKQEQHRAVWLRTQGSQDPRSTTYSVDQEGALLNVNRS